MQKGIGGMMALILCTGISVGQPSFPGREAPRADVVIPAVAPKAACTTFAAGGGRSTAQLPAAQVELQPRPPAQMLPALAGTPERVLPGVSKSAGSAPAWLPDRAVSRAPAAPAAPAVPGAVPQDSGDRAPLALPDMAVPGTREGSAGPDPFAPVAGTSNRFWAEADYLHWWVKGGPVAQPLLVTGSLADAKPGVLGQPGTVTLIGQSLNYPSMNGYRIGAGFWLDSQQQLGVEAHYFDLLQSRWGRFFNSGPGGAILLTRPIADTTSTFHTFDVAFPGALQGVFAAASATQLSGYDINLSGKVLNRDGLSVLALGGFRYLNLAEDLQMVQQSQALVGGVYTFNGAALPAGSLLGLYDSFQTQNQFFGAQVGARVQAITGRLILGAYAKLGIGENTQSSSINGASFATTPGGSPMAAPGGVFAQLSNMGQHTTSHFALVPEFGTNVAYQVTPWLRLRLGYDFLFWTNVIRPGAQIDTTLNLNNVPTAQQFGTMPGGPARPAVLFNRSEFWAQGVSVGLVFLY